MSRGLPSFDAMVEQAIARLCTGRRCEIGTVTSWTPPRTASVQLVLRDEEGVPYPVLHNLPVVYPLASSAGLWFELAVGDPVLVLFGRGVEEWKHLGGTRSLDGTHSPQLLDAIVLPGFFANSTTQPDLTGETGTVLGHFGATGANNRLLRLSSSGITLGDDAGNELLDILDGILEILIRPAPASFVDPVSHAILGTLLEEFGALRTKLAAIKG